MPSLFVELMGNNSRIKVIEFLLENWLFDFTKRDMERITKVPRIKLERIFNHLIKQKVLLKNKKEGKFYRINRNSEVAKALLRLDWAIIKSYPPFS